MHVVFHVRHSGSWKFVPDIAMRTIQYYKMVRLHSSHVTLVQVHRMNKLVCCSIYKLMAAVNR